VHYPSHVEAMRVLRPGAPVVDFRGWMRANFHPGITEFLRGDLRMNPAEMDEEFRIWRRHNEERTPDFFPGMLELLRDFRAAGGKVAVISHSERDIIERHYRAADGGAFIPDLIFGWDHDETRRKPHPWPVEEALRLLGADRREALIVDDLKPGVLMSRATGVPIAAAGWGHDVPEIRDYMRESCAAYLETVEALRRYLLAD
jgi:beta-phosphoglucomutase-like phosphatase (HAD superfamily)